MTSAINPGEIKAFVFDVGGVLALDAPRYFLSEVAVREGLEIEELVKIWRKNIGQLTRGEMTENEFWLAFISELNLKTPPEDLLVRFKEDIRLFLLLDKGFIEYLRSFKEELNTHRKEPVKFAILSNNVKEWTQELAKQFDLPSLFDEILYSSDEGEVKPDKIIFQKILVKLDVNPHEALVVDNREKNILAAKELGMHGILFSDPEEFKAAMTVMHFSKPAKREMINQHQQRSE